MKPAHLLMLLVINMAWAGNVISTKEMVLSIPPLLAMALRFAVVLLVCLPFLRPVPGRMGLVLLTGLIAGAFQFGFYGVAYHASDNVSALAIAAQLGVPFSLILAVLVEGERIAWRRTLGIVLGVAGVLILAFDPRIADERFSLLLVALASLSWAATNLMFRRLAGIPVMTLYGWQAVISLPVLLTGSLLLEPGSIAGLKDAPISAFGWVIYSGILSSIVGHAGIAWLLQRYPVSTITPFTLLAPVLSVILASLVYRTPVTPLMLVGGCMALTGVAIISLRAGKGAAKEGAVS